MYCLESPRTNGSKFMNSHKKNISRPSLELFLLLTVALALPWELFQRIPGTDITLTRIAGAVLILLVAAKKLRTRKFSLSRTGFEFPILVLLLAVAVSVIFSADRPVSLKLLCVYISYVLFFYAVSETIDSTRAAKALCTAFCASAALLSLLAISCHLHFLVPTLVDTLLKTSLRVTPEKWNELGTRMAVAGDDFNQGALPMLAALALVLFGAYEKSNGLRASLLRVLGSAFLVCGIFTTLSRTSIIIAVILVVAALAFSTRGKPKLRPHLVALLLLLAAIAYSGFWQRMLLLISNQDPSMAGRMGAYLAALKLLPRYALLGTGIGVSDSVIAASEHAQLAGGVTIHSVPFKLLIECGVFGLVAYLWLCFKALTRLAKRAVSPNDYTLAKPLLAMWLAFFFTTLVQPFAALPIFPFFFGISCGALFAKRKSKETGPGTAPSIRSTVIASVALVFLVVGFNVFSYQLCAKKVAAFVNVMESGVMAEQRGDWKQASDLYTKADSLVSGFENHRFSHLAIKVYDFDSILETMAVSPGQNSYASFATTLARGHVSYVQGGLSQAEDDFRKSIQRAPQKRIAHYALAETLWDAGKFSEALKEYDLASDKSIEAAADLDIAGLLEHARKLRRLGRWEDALELYKTILSTHPDEPDALFNMGVEAEIKGDFEAGKKAYAHAYRSSPQHRQSITRLLDLLQ